MKRTLLILISGLALTCIAAPGFAFVEGDLNIHGFYSQGFISTTENSFILDSEDGSFEFNEVGLNFSKRLMSGLHVGVQFFARDFGDTGNNEIKLDWALADFRLKDWLGLRFGQIKAPHGLYNEYRDIDLLRTSIFLPQSVYPEILRDVTLSIQGVGLYGNIGMDALGMLSYQAYYGTQIIDPNSRLAEILAGYPQSSIDNQSTDVDRKYVGSVIWDTPLPGLRLGASYSNVSLSLSGQWNSDVYVTLEDGTQVLAFERGGNVELECDPYENWVYSLEYTWRDLILMAEYMNTRKKYDNSITGKGESDYDGWYAGATYRFTDWFELGAYYSVTDNGPSTDDPAFTLPDYYFDLTDICVTTRFDLSRYWTLKLEYHDLTGAFGLSAWDNPVDEAANTTPSYFEEDWTMFAVKLTVAF